MSSPPGPMAERVVLPPHFHHRDPRPCYCALVPDTDEAADHTRAHQQATRDSIYYEAAAKARQQTNMLSSSSASMNTAYSASSQESRVARAARPLPPLPSTHLRGVPAPVQQAAQNPPAAPAGPSTPKRSHGRRHPGGSGDYSASQSGAALRRRGTLFATDVPIPHDYEAPPPFHAIDAGSPPEAHSYHDSHARTSPPPPGTSFPGGQNPPRYSQLLPHYSPGPVNARQPVSRHSAQSSISSSYQSSSRPSAAQHTRTGSYDAPSFYSSAVSSHLASTPYQSPHSYRAPPSGTAFR
ncbi:hypothetical protein AURDEDRAFT_141745 [Auricularia subglabra TFB-10046 SS5]|nr:hypothetical protein AURDEDRAFT_141745 [Auricularia subglabra TFB-10046 SS5]